tara:strand:- start:269 stop:430 length:162 start_codon:yes stop_codon:yes gene_type:complete
MINKIGEYFKTTLTLFMFGTKTLWIILTTSMKKEAQTYKEEREAQKRVKNGEK